MRQILDPVHSYGIFLHNHGTVPRSPRLLIYGAPKEGSFRCPIEHRTASYPPFFLHYILYTQLRNKYAFFGNGDGLLNGDGLCSKTRETLPHFDIIGHFWPLEGPLRL